MFVKFVFIIYYFYGIDVKIIYFYGIDVSIIYVIFFFNISCNINYKKYVIFGFKDSINM